MKTRAAALSSDAVCNLTAGSASLPFTKPGLFWKSCDLVWRRACQFQQPLKTFFLLENLNYSVAERELKLWGRSGTEGTSAFQSGQRVLLSNFAFHLCCLVVFFFIPSPIVFFFFLSVFHHQTGARQVSILDPVISARRLHKCPFEFQLTFFHHAEASAVDACVN